MPPTIVLHEPVVVSQAPADLRQWGPWQFPAVQRLPDGRLAVAFHVEADSATAYGMPRRVLLSADEGQSWQPAEAAVTDILTSKLIKLPNGDLLRQVQQRSVAPETVLELLPPSLGETSGGYGHPLTVFDAAQVPAELAGYRFTRRRAGSDTWLEEHAEVRIPGAIRTLYMGVLTFPWLQRIVPAPDGSLWGVDYGKRLVHGHVQQQLAARFLRSTDAGHTWDFLGEIPYQPDPATDPDAASRDGFTEPNIAFLADGSVFCLLRTTDGHGVGPMYSSRSTDGGHTWSIPRWFDDLGVWPALVNLACGVTLAAYGRPGLFLRATTDSAAQTWSERVAVVPPLALQRDTCSYADVLAVGEQEALIAYSDFNVADAQGRPCKTILVRRISLR